MKNIKKICITGGPCAGKTTLLEKLHEELNYENLTILYVPESGSNMIGSGIKPFEDNVGLFNFQIFNLKNQLHQENLFLEAANCMQNENILIICDRTTVEQQVFIEKDEFNEILKIFNIKEQDLIDSYDGVFHLVTAAIGAEYAYGMQNNKNRIHKLEEARRQDILALKIWENHKNLFVFDNNIDFNTKIENSFNSIKNFIDKNFNLV